MTSLSVMPPTPDCRTCAPTSSVPSLASAPWMASDRALHIGLEHQRQQALFAGLAGLEQLIERLARGRGLARFAALAGAIFGDFAGARFGFHHHHFVAGFGRAGKAQHFDRRGGPGAFHGFAAIVLQAGAPGPIRSPPPRYRRPSACRAAPARWRRGRGPCRAWPRSPRLRRLRSGLALRSRISACSRIASSSLSRLVPLVAETSTAWRFAAHVFDLDFMLQQFGLDPRWDWRRPCRSC